jgi:hypothetical protein
MEAGDISCYYKIIREVGGVDRASVNCHAAVRQRSGIGAEFELLCPAAGLPHRIFHQEESYFLTAEPGRLIRILL